MRAYAEGTSVPVERTRAEIDRLLTSNGATATAIFNNEENAIASIAFALHGARFRIDLPLPTKETLSKVATSPGWHRKSSAQQAEAWKRAIDQARRERWRQLLLLLKAKLEAVRLGLSTVEREFMADLILPNGATVHQSLAEALRNGLGSGAAPKQLGVGLVT